MDEPRFKISKVARVAGISTETIKNWERKERALIRREQDGPFSTRRALQVIAMAKLVELNVEPKAAAELSFEYTDTAGAALPGIRSARKPGENFEDGCTILCAFPGGVVEVKNLQPGNDWASLFTPLMHNRCDAVTALDVTSLRRRVIDALESST